MTDREHQLRTAAIKAAYGEATDHPEPAIPSAAEEGFLAAIDLFRHGRQCAGWDAFELAEKFALHHPGKTTETSP